MSGGKVESEALVDPILEVLTEGYVEFAQYTVLAGYEDATAVDVIGGEGDNPPVVGPGVGFAAGGPVTREEASGAYEGDDEVGVDDSVEGKANGVVGEVAVVGPEGTVVDADVDAVAVCFEADAVDRALTDGVVTIVAAVVAVDTRAFNPFFRL